MRDDDLHHRLAELASEAEAGLALSSSRGVRSRGDRRRAGVTTAAAGLAILSVAAGGVTIFSAMARTTPLGAGASSDEPSAGPTGSAIPRPSAFRFPSGHPVGPPSQGPRKDFVPLTFTKIPASLSMLHEGEAGWTTVNDVNVRSAYNPCGETDVTLTGRTDARTVKGPGLPVEESHSPSKVTHQLFLFATEKAATEAFVKLSAGGCGWTKSMMNVGEAEDTHLARLRSSESPTQQPGVYWLHDANLVRSGNALLVAHADASGAAMTSNMADQELNYILNPLCQARLICR
ncbi:MAG TPA: hypothetical protein VFC19_52700 [Candidatus Limnocylindrales bacterium]|nr:hypothetical protein [Candidatus Limnocylindrales bacterium]